MISPGSDRATRVAINDKGKNKGWWCGFAGRDRNELILIYNFF